MIDFEWISAGPTRDVISILDDHDRALENLKREEKRVVRAYLNLYNLPRWFLDRAEGMKWTVNNIDKMRKELLEQEKDKE